MAGHTMPKTKEATMTLLPRDVGKTAAKKTRREGKVPAVVYGHAMEPISVAVDERTFLTSYRQGPVLTVTLPSGEGARVLVREFRTNPISGRPEHIDFQLVAAGETLRSEVHVTLDEEALLLKAGLLPSWVLDHVAIEAKPDALPERIHIHAGGLGYGDEVKAGDLDLPAGVKLMTDPEAVLLIVLAPKTEVAEARAEGRTEQAAETGGAEVDAGQ